MFQRISSLIILILLTQQVGANDSQPGIDPLNPGCELKLSEIHEATIFNPIIEADPLELTSIAPITAYGWMFSKTFSVERVVKGIFGGERVVLKARTPWVRDNKDSLVGPRLPLAKFGVEEARFVGFQQISYDELVVPTLNEGNRFINYFNRNLDPSDPRFIKLTGYNSLNTGKDPREIVRRYARGLEAPISDLEVGTLLLGALSTNNETVAALQNRILTWLDFSEQLPGLSRQNPDFVKLDNKMFEYFSVQISQLMKGEALPYLQLPPQRLVTVAQGNANIAPRFPLLFQAFLVKEANLHPERFKKISSSEEQSAFDLRMTRLRELSASSMTVN